tara:strand:- start:14427 stop:16937 length:2511 start_codon:yes stop_codon:yes gene_type:complete
MNNTETWMGSGQSVTLAPESELFLGYSPYGPTFGRYGTSKAHLIKYSLGYGTEQDNTEVGANHGMTLSVQINGATPDDGDTTLTIFNAGHNLQVGMSISGTNIPAGTTITAINSTTEIVISQAPTTNLANAETLQVAQNTHFTDYYHLVPDLYTGCTAKFFYTDTSTAEPTYRFSAVVAGNDADAIYFSGNLLDYPVLNSDFSGDLKRGYIILEANGSTIPAPISLENRGACTAITVGPSVGDNDESIVGAEGIFSSLKLDDIITSSTGIQIGKVWTYRNDDTASVFRQDGTGDGTHIHTMSAKLATVKSISGSSTFRTIVLENIVNTSSTTTKTDLSGIFTAGDIISSINTDNQDIAIARGIIVGQASDGLTWLIRPIVAPLANDHVYWGREVSELVGGVTSVHTVSPRVLSNNWIGLTNSVGIPQVEQETKQMNMSLAGSRNYSYQYRGMETAGSASIDVNLNHGSWLFYAFGGLNSVSFTHTDKTQTNAFECVDASSSAHKTYAGFSTDADRNTTGHTSNGKFHRVLAGSKSLCPPLLPNTGAGLLTLPSESGGTLQHGITYTFNERNDNKLPSFSLELLVQKGSVLDGTNRSLMVDRNTYSENVYAQIYPGCVVSDMQLTANENEEVKSTLNLNVKRVFEAEGGYVGKCYDSTNNDTTEFKNLLNFGQQTGNNTNIVQSFVDPFFFSNGSISLFGQEFLKVTSFTMNLQNGLQDKRYIGQYNKQIKSYVTGQRTYEISIQALVSDRRIFDELRRQSPHRFVLNETADGSNAKIVLQFVKPNGEQITLEFDDYLISAATWPIQDDRGPVQVDFTIMPLRVGTLNATTHWVMQS